jgi:hypothetical protein
MVDNWQRAPGLGKVMARWRVDYLGKIATHLGTVEGADKKSAIDAAAKQFNITPARRDKILVTPRVDDI